MHNTDHWARWQPGSIDNQQLPDHRPYGSAAGKGKGKFLGEAGVPHLGPYGVFSHPGHPDHQDQEVLASSQAHRLPRPSAEPAMLPLPGDSAASERRTPAEVPIWANPMPGLDIRVWWFVLDRLSVDNLARFSLYSLSQHSPAGYSEANHIINALIRLGPDGLENASRYIHNACSNARTRLRQLFEGAMLTPSRSSRNWSSRNW